MMWQYIHTHDGCQIIHGGTELRNTPKILRRMLFPYAVYIPVSMAGVLYTMASRSRGTARLSSIHKNRAIFYVCISTTNPSLAGQTLPP